MHGRTVRHLLGAAIAIGVVALLPATAAAHPEACANTGAFSGSLSGMVLGSPADEKSEGCLSASVVNSFDDSNAALASAGTSDGTDNLTLLSNTPKPAPFEAEGDFNSDLAFENGFAYGATERRRRSPRPSTARGRRTTSPSTTGSWSPRPTPAAPTPAARARRRPRRRIRRRGRA
jgi:hypothetical protein